MHPRLAEIVDYLAESRAALVAAIADIPAERQDERVGEGVWTVGEVLDHLAIIERNVARLVERRAERARTEGVAQDADSSSLLSMLDHYRIDSTERRLDAPEQVRPRAGATAATAIASLAESRRALLAAIERADGLDLSALRARHPILGELDLYAWLLLIGKHERRHVLQLAGLRAALATR